MDEAKDTLIVIAHFDPSTEYNGSKLRLISMAKNLARHGLNIVYVRTGTRDVYEFDSEEFFTDAQIKWLQYRKARPDLKFRAIVFMWAWISRSKNNILKSMRLENPKLLTILDANDLLAERKYREQLSTSFQYERPQKAQDISFEIERNEFQSCDIILGITPEEVRSISRFTDRPVLELGYFPPIETKPGQFKKIKTDTDLITGFFGSQNSANLSALYRTAVIARMSGKISKFLVAGYVCRYEEEMRWLKELFGEDWFCVLGDIDNPAEFYHGVDFATYIFAFGSGLKIKIVEALQHGCRVITNDIGAEGFEPSSELGVFVADSVIEFNSTIDSFSKVRAPKRGFAQQVMERRVREKSDELVRFLI